MSEKIITRNQAENDILACAAFLAEGIASSDGHSQAMNEIVPLYLAKGDVDTAAQLADGINEPYTRDRLLSDVAVKCAELNDDEYGFQLIEAIDETGFRTIANERMIVAKADQGEFEKALEYAKELPDDSNALAAIAINLAKKGETSEADETADKIGFPISRFHAFNGIASVLVEAEKSDEAILFLEKARNEIAEIDFVEDKLRSLNELANRYIDLKQTGKAIEVLSEARTLAETLDTYNREAFLVQISFAYAHAGNFEMAERIAEPIEELYHSALAFAGIAAEHITRENYGEAIDLLEEAYSLLRTQKDKEVRDSAARFSLFSQIAVRLAVCGKFERGLEIALENPVEDERNAALSRIANAATLSERDEFVKQALEAMSDDGEKTFALIGIHDANLKEEKSERALTALQSSLDLADSIPQIPLRSQALNVLASRFNQNEKKENAHEILGRSLETVSHILDDANKAVALANLAEAYEKVGIEIGEQERIILERILLKASR